MSHFPFQRLQADLATLISKTRDGDRLPSEPDLAKQLGVSRATLREAMRSFETQGLIRRRQGAGTFVVGQVPVIDAGLELLESLDTMAFNFASLWAPIAIATEKTAGEAIGIPATTNTKKKMTIPPMDSFVTCRISSR